jgi:CTD small phosphatase-like protein 2
VLFPNRKTLIFDLDETLVHCMGQRKGHISVKILFPDSRECFAGINLRPYLAECLEAASQLFEVVVFTASRKFYADAVINHIDPEQKYFHHRLYSDSCVKYGNFNVKDLRLLNRRLQDVVIVDNSIFSFAFQLDNGVPIIPWVNDPLDTELKQLIEYFNAVNEVADVREFNRRLFGLDSFYDDYFEEYGNK